MGSVPDAQRQLTRGGRADAATAAAALLQQCRQQSLPAPDAILHSPYRRTTHTAAISGDTFTGADCRPLSPLAPGHNAVAVDEALSRDFDGYTGHLLLVSHQPLVSWLAQHWLGSGHPVPGLTPAGFYTLELGLAAPLFGELLFWGLPPDYQVCRI